MKCIVPVQDTSLVGAVVTFRSFVQLQAHWIFMIIYINHIRKIKDRVHGKWKYKSTEINVNRGQIENNRQWPCLHMLICLFLYFLT